MIPGAGSDLTTPSVSAAGGYGPPPGGYGGPPMGGPPPGGFGGPPGYGGPPPGAPPGFGGPPGFAGPPGYGGPPGFGGDRMAAESKIKPPAITMMICTVIGFLFQLFGLIMHIVGTGMNAANSPEGDELAHLMNGVAGLVMNVVGLLFSGFCIWAFLKMMKLESRTMAYIAVIASMVPCTGSCCWLNLFIGIWALIVLADPVVKQAYQS